MTDYISHVSELLDQGKPVIFYTVSSVTFSYIRELKNRFGKKPTAICDADVNKQGKSFRGLDDIQIIAPQEAIEYFSDGYFFICSPDYRYEIIGYLTDTCGLNPERILNYVPVKKVRSCLYIQKAIYYDQFGDLGFCCMGVGPVVKDTGDVDVDTKTFLNLRNTLLQTLEDPQVKTNTPCDGCPQVCERYYPEKPLSWTIYYFGYNHCNYKCSYCNVWKHEWEDSRKGEQSLGVLIQKFNETGILSPDYRVAISTAGEPSIHPMRKGFYDSFDGTELVVTTNGFVFDTDLYETMQTQRVLVNCSIDAGTKETYAKIKGVDGFMQVRKNMMQYAQAATGIVALKYIVTPNINDTAADADGFVELCVETGASFAMIALEIGSMDKVTPQVKDTIYRLKNGLDKNHIFSIPYMSNATNAYADLMKKLWQGV